MSGDGLSLERRLKARKQELEIRIGKISDDIRHVNHPVEADSAEAVVDHENDEVIDALGNAAVEELTEVNRALQRIADGDYGTCERCGIAISEQRLEVVPNALECRTCAE